MKIEINLQEIFCEGNEDSCESIQQALKTNIIYDVVNKIKTDYKKQIDNQIRKIAEERVKILYTEIYKNELEKEILQSDISENSYKDSPKVPFNIFIKNRIQSYCENSYGGIKEVLDRLAEKQAKEIKSKYDMLFASQIVNKIAEQGLLKEEKLKELLK